MFRTFLFAAVLLALQACSTPSTEQTRIDTSVEGVDLFERLAGTWIARESGSDHWFEEHWTMLDNGDLDGLGLVRSGMDTVMIEHLRISRSDTATWYSARIPSQNNSEPVLFRMVSDYDSLSFVNPEHDHPQRITYLPESSDGWRVRVIGNKHGQVVEELLLFQPMPAATPALP